VSYYKHFLNQVIDVLRTNPQLPQKIRYETTVLLEQLARVEQPFLRGLAICHVLYVPFHWIAGSVKTFTPAANFVSQDFEQKAECGEKPVAGRALGRGGRTTAQHAVANQLVLLPN
jgi:hypothetical protein